MEESPYQSKSPASLIQLEPPADIRSNLSESIHSLPPVIHLQYPRYEEPPNYQREQSAAMEQASSGEYYCMRCNKNYNINISSCKHKKGDKPKYKCSYDDCSKSFPIEASLERHKLIHQGVKPYECDYQNCDQRFNQKSNLNRHKRIHTQEKPFICQTCCKSFTTTTNLKQHVQVHLEDRDRRKKYMCSIKGCNKEYLYMCNLKKHKQEHEDPLGDCLVEKKPDFPVFSITIGSCSFRIAYKKSKQHSELMITYDAQESNATTLKYSLDVFSNLLTQMQVQTKGDDFSALSGHVEQMDNIVRNFFEETKNSLNIAFQMHQDLRPLASVLMKTLMNVIGETNLRVFTLIVPQFGIFSELVNNLMSQFQPRD